MPTRLRSICNKAFCIAKSAVMHPTGIISLFLPLTEPFSDGVRPSARALCRETFSGVIHSPSLSSSSGSSYNGGGSEDGASTSVDSGSSEDGAASAVVVGCPWLSSSLRGTSSTSRRSRACSIESRPSSRGFRSPSVPFFSALSAVFVSWDEVASSAAFCVGVLESAASADELG
jgi:hypothetical protein